MTRAKIIFKGHFAGILEKSAGKYIFTYNKEYYNDPKSRSISLSLPKTPDPYYSDVLFPFFFGLLAEGTIKELQCRILKIDENDHFTRLLKTACADTIGAVTIEEIKE